MSPAVVDSLPLEPSGNSTILQYKIKIKKFCISEVTDISPRNSSTYILQFSQLDLLTVPTVLGGVINKGTQKQERRAILGAQLKGQVSKFGNYLPLILSPERNSIFSTV